MKDRRYGNSEPCLRSGLARGWPFLFVLATGLLLAATTACKGPSSTLPAGEVAALATAPVRLNPGDVVQITFPANPQLNTSERVRLDGKIALSLIGEVSAAGKTPAELQADLAQLYAKQLDVREVVVIMASSSASVFVSGAVAHPGRITLERPLSVLDAIMEAGGFDPRRANVKKVSIIRQKNGTYTRQTVNLKPVLKGENLKPLMLEPFDIVYVPEKLF